MLTPDLTSPESGVCAEIFVRYKLTRWGYTGIIIPPTKGYDILVVENGVRVQVKSARHPDDYSYRFNTQRGGSSKSQRYTEDEYDLLCVVALDIERLLFFEHVDQLSFRVKQDRFIKEMQYQSFCDMLDKIGKSV